jgi:hypothetical protein
MDVGIFFATLNDCSIYFNIIADYADHYVPCQCNFRAGS